MASKKKIPKRYVQVRVNRVLLWPEEVMPEYLERIWARAGVALDMTDEALWELTDGQRHKLADIDARAFAAIEKAGRVWTEDMAADLILRRLRDARERLKKDPNRGGARGDDNASKDEKAAAPPSTPAADEEPDAAPRRAADVEAALAAEDA